MAITAISLAPITTLVHPTIYIQIVLHAVSLLTSYNTFLHNNHITSPSNTDLLQNDNWDSVSGCLTQIFITYTRCLAAILSPNLPLTCYLALIITSTKFTSAAAALHNIALQFGKAAAAASTDFMHVSISHSSPRYTNVAKCLSLFTIISHLIIANFHQIHFTNSVSLATPCFLSFICGVLPLQHLFYRVHTSTQSHFSLKIRYGTIKQPDSSSLTALHSLPSFPKNTATSPSSNLSPLH